MKKIIFALFFTVAMSQMAYPGVGGIGGGTTGMIAPEGKWKTNSSVQVRMCAEGESGTLCPNYLIRSRTLDLNSGQKLNETDCYSSKGEASWMPCQQPVPSKAKKIMQILEEE